MCMAQQCDTLDVLKDFISPLIDDLARHHPIASESLAIHVSLFFDIDVTADSCFYLGMRRL